MIISDKTRNILEWIFCIVVAFVLAILIKYFVGTPTIVSQVSMRPTLQSGQRLILNRWMRTIKTGCLRQAPLHDSPTLRTMQKKSETASLVRKLPRRVPLYFCMARSYANFPFTKL